MTGRRPRAIPCSWWVMLLLLLVLGGCGRRVDTTYGKSRSESINGTGAFARLFRSAGHEVRSAYRLTDELSGWADVIVRFSSRPGAPEKDEAAWYDTWLDTIPGRRLIYVPFDYDATEEYWTRALEGLPSDATPRLRERIEEGRKESANWANRLPAKAKEVASAEDWFAVENASASQVCKTLTGPWAKGIDPAKARLTRHEPLKVKYEIVLLSGDGKPLVITWHRNNGSDVLVAANGTFLLNLPLVEPARWPLAKRTVDWAINDQGNPDGNESRPLKVAFIEGRHPLINREAMPSVFGLLNVSPFGRVAAQLFALGLIACLARAPRLGRPRPSEPSGADRPVAHPEALGALLARTGQAGEARSLLETYRRWRHGSHVSREKTSKKIE